MQNAPEQSSSDDNGKVVVLLSSYNGAKYLAEQIELILAQTWTDLTLVIRDDGSNDFSWQVLQAWRNHPRVRISRGANIGVTASFLTLLRQCGGDVDFVGFADQDDVWLPDKVERAVVTLRQQPQTMPALYCARSVIVDQELGRSAKALLALDADFRQRAR